MSMRQTVRKNPAECTGCGACVSICPKQAITMQPDAEGFLYPKVDGEKCVGCGACVEACPWHMPTVNPETGKSSKCIACGICVKACPMEVLEIVEK